MMTHDAVGYKKEPTGRRRTDVCIGGPTPDVARVGRAVRPVRRDLPGGDRHLHDGRRATVDPGRAGPADCRPAVGGHRLRAGLRRIRAARRARGRPAGAASHVRDLAGGVRRLLRPGWARHGGLDADPRPVRDRRGRGLPHPGRSVDHHHDVRRGAAAGPGPARLRRYRRRRILTRDGHRRPAHRPALAVGVLRARRRGRRPAGRGHTHAPPPGRSARRPLRHRRLGDADRRHAGAGARNRPGPA
jgi:hypothetical protein